MFIPVSFDTSSDSLSSLIAIHNHHLEMGYVQKFISDYSQLVNSGKTITLCWILVLVSEVTSVLMCLQNLPSVQPFQL